MIPEAILMSSMKSVIDNFIKNIVTPKLESFVSECKLQYNELLIPRGEHFQEYLFRTYKKYSIINTLVFKNEQRLLKDLYIPLTIYKETHHRHKEERIKVEGYPVELLKKYNKLLITDTAGMGKSTLTKRMFLDIVENGYGIPLYVELRRLNKSHTILKEIKEQIDSLSKEFDLTLLYRFIQTGGFIFILDGYDEISSNERSNVTSNIQEFISKADNNTFILTSRPENGLTCFGDFQCFKINSLNKSEAYDLLRKYDGQGDTSTLLISELKKGNYEMINEFLANPLLVSLLFAAFDYKQTIPLKKHIFYRQVYDAYFDSHDLSKGGGYIHEKSTGLDIDDFDRVLRHVGYKCLKEQKIEFDKDSLLKIINDAKNDCADLDFTASDFFTDILTSVPLFCNDGQYYKWVHKSIQEYFAAQFIYRDSKENQDKILTAMYNSENLDKYINLLDIYYDIDNWGFTKNITQAICKEYCSYYETNIKKLSMIDAEDAAKRIAYIYLVDVCFIKVNQATFEEDKNPFQHIRDMVISCGVKPKCIGTYRRHDTELMMVVAFHEHPKRNILNLMHRKKPYLFFDDEDNIYKNLLELPWECNKAHKVDIYSFMEDKAIYKIVNQHLQYSLPEGDTLNYSACKKELANIDSMLLQKANKSSIVDGL